MSVYTNQLKTVMLTRYVLLFYLFTGCHLYLAAKNYCGWIQTVATILNATSDNTPPSVETYLPANSATDISPNTPLSLTFSENVKKRAGNIIIRDTNHTSVETIDIASALVTIENASHKNIIRYTIYDLQGSKILSGTGRSINVETLDSGMYIIHIGNTVQRFIKL